MLWKALVSIGGSARKALAFGLQAQLAQQASHALPVSVRTAALRFSQETEVAVVRKLSRHLSDRCLEHLIVPWLRLVIMREAQEVQYGAVRFLCMVARHLITQPGHFSGRILKSAEAFYSLRFQTKLASQEFRLGDADLLRTSRFAALEDTGGIGHKLGFPFPHHGDSLLPADNLQHHLNLKLCSKLTMFGHSG